MSLTPVQQSIASRIFSALVQGNDVNQGIPETLANIAVAQSAHETGGWTSNFFVNNNNAFGYSCVPGAKWQNGCSVGSADNGIKVGNYDSIEDSAQELVDWIYRRINDGEFPSDLDSITTSDQYSKLLKNAGYYGDTYQNYATDVKKWITKIGNFLKQP